MYSSVFTLLSFGLAAVGAKNIDIRVGQNGTIKFVPDSMMADVGDTLRYHFYNGSGPHSVVSGSLANPCMPEIGSLFSDYIEGDATGDMTYEVNITSTTPIWFYCSLKKHCQGGMVGVVNPPSNATVTDYANAAKNVSAASAPSSATGGVSTSVLPTSTGSMNMSMPMTSMSMGASSTAMTTTAAGGAGSSATSKASSAAASATSSSGAA
ncbi:putative GPI-anchored cupredoxin, partial [Lachnellula suecica]